MKLLKKYNMETEYNNLNYMLFFIFFSIFVVSAISLTGVFALSLSENRLKSVLIHLVGFSAGALLGDVFLHLLPQAAENGFTLQTSLFVIAGILFGFITEKIICWRHCHLPVTKIHIHEFAFMNLLGDFMHNILDGVVIAASYSVNLATGVATTIAVLIHEIPQEIGDFGVLLHGGFSRAKALKLNFFTACSAFAGAIIFLILPFDTEAVLPNLIALAAGNFIYIAGSDLIPELHKDEDIKNGLVQFFIILAGILVMFAFLALE